MILFSCEEAAQHLHFSSVCLSVSLSVSKLNFSQSKLDDSMLMKADDPLLVTADDSFIMTADDSLQMTADDNQLPNDSW